MSDMVGVTSRNFSWSSECKQVSPLLCPRCCSYICVSVHIGLVEIRRQLEGLCSLLTTWVLRIKLRSSELGASAFTLWAILPALKSFYPFSCRSVIYLWRTMRTEGEIMRGWLFCLLVFGCFISPMYLLRTTLFLHRTALPICLMSGGHHVLVLNHKKADAPADTCALSVTVAKSMRTAKMSIGRWMTDVVCMQYNVSFCQLRYFIYMYIL